MKTSNKHRRFKTDYEYQVCCSTTGKGFFCQPEHCALGAS